MLRSFTKQRLTVYLELDTRIQELRKTTLVGRERELATDQCLADIARFSNEVKDASPHLPSYDLRIHSDVNHFRLIQSVEADILL